MKKDFLLLLCLCVSFALPTYAETGTIIKVRVTEKVPGANCTTEYGSGSEGQTQATGFYECSLTAGFSATVGLFGQMIRWLAAMATIGAVLFIVINGIRLSMGGIDSGAKESAKKNITQTLIGLVLLILTGVFLAIVAPWVYK